MIDSVMKRIAAICVPLLLLTGCTKTYNPNDAISIDVSGFTTTFKCGDAYAFDGEIKTTYVDGTTRTLKANEYYIDYSSYIPFSLEKANINIIYGQQTFTYTVTRQRREAFKILMIGNSFSDDTEAFLKPLATAYGLNSNDVIVADLYIGGCSIDMHVDNAKNNKNAYIYRDWYGAASNDENYVSIKDALNKEDWDFITVQQASGYSGIKESYNNLPYLVNYIKSNCKNKKVNIAWLQTWAYAKDSTHADFAKYHNNQNEMYEAICDAYKEKVAPNKNIIDLIPCGTAIQNAREGVFGDTLNRDGYHLSLTTGRFIAALTAFTSITGYLPENVPIVPEEYSQEEEQCIKNAVKNALLNRLVVTNN